MKNHATILLKAWNVEKRMMSTTALSPEHHPFSTVEDAYLHFLNHLKIIVSF